jgi:phosphate transport system substrate-binding protein
VSGGKPGSKLVQTFLKWILADGQNFVTEAGYVTIKPEQITTELLKLN